MHPRILVRLAGRPGDDQLIDVVFGLAHDLAFGLLHLGRAAESAGKPQARARCGDDQRLQAFHVALIGNGSVHFYRTVAGHRADDILGT